MDHNTRSSIEPAMPQSLHSIFTTPDPEIGQESRRPDSRPEKVSKVYVRRPFMNTISLVFGGLVMLFFTAVCTAPAMALWIYFPNLEFDLIPLAHWSLLVVFCGLGYFYAKFVLTIFIHLLDRCSTPRSLLLVYWMFGCRGHLSLFLHMTALALVLNFSLFNQSRLWIAYSDSINKLLFAVAIGVLGFAYKNHLLKKISMSFSHTNYIDRVIDYLFVDRMLRILGKHRFKYKKDRVKHRTGEQSVWNHLFRAFGSLSNNIYRDNNQLNLLTIRTESELTIHNWSEHRNKNSSSLVLNPFDIERELAAFRKMAGRLMSQFTNEFFSQDMTQEIRREAVVLSRKILKRLIPSTENRSYLVRNDLAQVIENEEDLTRFWGMVVGQYMVGDTFEQSGRDAKSYEGDKLQSMHHTTRQSNTLPPSHIAEKQLEEFVERTNRDIIGLFKSLNSMEAAIDKLAIFFNLLLGGILVIFLALLFGDVLAALTSISSLIFGAAFMFGSSAKNVFESIIFLFVTHPFDVGDRVYISLNPPSGPLKMDLPGSGALLTNASPSSGVLENLVVAEMNLITTLFERWDGAKLYIPNHVLATKPIVNVKRSGSLFEAHRLQVAFETPTHLIKEIGKRVAEFVEKEPYDYTNSIFFNAEMVEDCNRLHLMVIVQHRSNGQDFEAHLLRKSKILMFLKETCECLKIVYYPPIQRIEMCPGQI